MAEAKTLSELTEDKQKEVKEKFKQLEDLASELRLIAPKSFHFIVATSAEDANDITLVRHHDKAFKCSILENLISN